MKPVPFDYHRASSADEAITLLADHGENARLIAGGQSLVPMMNLGLASPDHVIDISDVSALDFVREEGGGLQIGAVATHNSIIGSDLVASACPLLIEAYNHVAHHTVRNRGTLGGNICHSDPASEMPLVLTLLDASMVIRGPGGERVVPASEFFVGEFETAVNSQELLTEIRIPSQSKEEGYAFEEVSQRKGDFSIVSAACRLTVAGGKIKDVRLGLTGAGPENKRMSEVEAHLEGADAGDSIISDAADLAARQADPTADLHADEDYKRDLVRALSRRVLARAVQIASQ